MCLKRWYKIDVNREKNEASKMEKELMITVFTEDTYRQNKKYCQENGVSCLYSTPVPISQTIETDCKLFVLEANNTNNRICGIGYIKNHPKTKTIYNDENFNKHNGFVYVGKCHLERRDVSCRQDEIVFELLDQLCFYGKGHVKRFRGIQRFPRKWLDNLLNSELHFDLIARIEKMMATVKTTQNNFVKNSA